MAVTTVGLGLAGGPLPITALLLACAGRLEVAVIGATLGLPAAFASVASRFAARFCCGSLAIKSVAGCAVLTCSGGGFVAVSVGGSGGTTACGLLALGGGAGGATSTCASAAAMLRVVRAFTCIASESSGRPKRVGIACSTSTCASTTRTVRIPSRRLGGDPDGNFIKRSYHGQASRALLTGFQRHAASGQWGSSGCCRLKKLGRSCAWNRIKTYIQVRNFYLSSFQMAASGLPWKCSAKVPLVQPKFQSTGHA